MSGSTLRPRVDALLAAALDEAAGPDVLVRSRFHVDRLDLGGPAPAAPDLDGAVFGLWLWRRAVDPAAVLAEVAARLRPGARVRFCEPSPGPTTVPGLGAVRTGYRFDRDLPPTIRSSGLIVTTIERFPLGPGAWFCAGIAEHDPAG